MQENENKFSEIKSRVVQFVEFKGLNKERFFTEIGVTSANFRGNAQKTPLNSNALANIFQKYPEINLQWLLTGDGTMLNTEPVHNIVAEPKIEYQSKKNPGVPLYDLTATAGVVGIFGDSKQHIPIDYITIPNMPKCDGAIHVVGDSMYPLLKSGDMVLYKKVNDKRNIIWGEMYIMYINNNGDEFFFVKWIHKSDKEDHIKLVSENRHHEPVEFHLDSVKDLAIVKASVRINSRV